MSASIWVHALAGVAGVVGVVATAALAGAAQAIVARATLLLGLTALAVALAVRYTHSDEPRVSVHAFLGSVLVLAVATLAVMHARARRWHTPSGVGVLLAGLATLGSGVVVSVPRRAPALASEYVSVAVAVAFAAAACGYAALAKPRYGYRSPRAPCTRRSAAVGDDDLRAFRAELGVLTIVAVALVVATAILRKPFVPALVFALVLALVSGVSLLCARALAKHGMPVVLALVVLAISPVVLNDMGLEEAPSSPHRVLVNCTFIGLFILAAVARVTSHFTALAFVFGALAAFAIAAVPVFASAPLGWLFITTLLAGVGVGGAAVLATPVAARGGGGARRAHRERAQYRRAAADDEEEAEEDTDAYSSVNDDDGYAEDAAVARIVAGEDTSTSSSSSSAHAYA